MTKHLFLKNPTIPPQFAVAPWTTGFSDVQFRWSEIIAEENLNPSLHPGWIQAVVESFSKSADTWILCQKNGETISGLISFFRSRSHFLGLPLNVIQLTSNLVSYHPELVSTGNQDTQLQQLIRHTQGWHVLHIANLLEDGPTARALNSLADRMGLRLLTYKIDSSPYLTISSNWDDFLASKNKKFRYKYRQRQKLLANNPNLTMSWFPHASNVPKLLDDMLGIEARSWKADKGVDISGNEIESRYYGRLLPFLAKNDNLMANVLYAESVPIAYNLCCSWNGWVGQLKTSFDPRFKDLSPGSIVIDAAIKRTFEIEAHEFDFLGHADQHKLAWTSTTREHYDYFLYSSALRARLIGAMRAFKKNRDSSSR